MIVVVSVVRAATTPAVHIRLKLVKTAAIGLRRVAIRFVAKAVILRPQAANLIQVVRMPFAYVQVP
jgi:hypothetical protein